MKKRSALIILLLLVVVGVGIRSYQLTARSLWFDEAFSWRLIQFSFDEMIERDASDVHPPLYYIALKGWSYIFETTLLSLRSFSVILAGLTIATSYLFTSYAFRSRGTGLLAATLLTFSGLQIQYAWEARMYTLGTALVLLSSWFLLKAIRESKSIYWAGYTFITVAFAYTHYFAFFSIAAQVVFMLAYILSTTRGRVGEILNHSVFWSGLLSGLGMLFIYSPWIPTFLRQNSQVQESYWIPQIGGWSIPDTFYRMFAPTSGIPNHVGVGWIFLAALPITLTGLGWLLLVITRRNGDAAWYVMLAGFIPFIITILLSLVSQSLYQDRFFVFAHLFIVIGLAVLISRIKLRKTRIAFSMLVILGFVLATGSYWQELKVSEKPGARAATDYIYDNRQGDEPITVSSPFIYFSILHYAEETYNDSTPKLFSETGELSHFSGGPILTTENITGPSVFDTDHENIWIVDTSGFSESKLELPPQWRVSSTMEYPEVFMHQGQVFVTKYSRVDS